MYLLPLMPRRQDAKPFNVVEIFGHSAPNATPDRRSRRTSGEYPALKHAANRARNAVGTALLEKRIERPLDCSRCAAHAPGRIAAIHADYTKPLQIEWVCLSCARYAWQAREDSCAVAMAKGGDYVNGVWVGPVGSGPRTDYKMLQAYSRKRGARGGDAGTQQALVKVRAGKPTPVANAVVQNFIATDMERYLSGLPSLIGEVLAGKGAEVVVRPAKAPVIAKLEVPADVIDGIGNYGDIVTVEPNEQEYQLVPVPGGILGRPPDTEQIQTDIRNTPQGAA